MDFVVCQATVRSEDANRRADGWKVRASQSRRALKMPTTSFPWCQPTGQLTKPPFLRGLPVAAERCREIINEGWYAARKSASHGEDVSETARGLFINVSQNPDRIKAVGPGLPTFTRNSMHYSYQHDVCVSGHTHMRGLGWPRRLTDTRRFSDHQMRELSGDGVSCPIYMLIECAVYNNPYAVWWQ